MLEASYNPFNWHWIVGSDASRYWSSASGAYVTTLPQGAGVTRIANEAELSAVLRPYGLQGPQISQDDYAAAIQAHLDAWARQRGYDNIHTAASYAGDPNATYAAEGVAARNARSAVWTYATAELKKVLSGQRTQPTVAALIDELPAMVWPA